MKNQEIFYKFARTNLEDEIKHPKKSNVPLTINALAQHYVRKYSDLETIENTYSDGEYDFDTIRKVIRTDSYARLMVDKFTAITLLRGWDYISLDDDDQPIEYIHKRIAEIEAVSDTIYSEYIEQLARILYGFSNSFIIKIRDKNASGGYPYKHPITKKIVQPISRFDYVDLMDYNMTIITDDFANREGYVIKKGNAILKELPASDVVHIKIYPHRLWGMPILSQVVDDITMLRRLEEDMVLQYFQNGIPPMVLTVPPSPNQSPLGEDPNIMYGREMLENMLAHGGIVITSDCKFDVVSPGSLLDMTRGIEHAKSRVLSGLHMSPLMIGENSGGKSSTNALIDDFIMQAKYVQSVLAKYMEKYIINELLLEGKIKTITKHVDRVKVFFPEIDIEYWSTVLNEMVTLFNSNLVTRTEARKQWGALPLKKLEEKDTVATIAPKQALTGGQSSQMTTPENQYKKKTNVGKKSRVNDTVVNIDAIIEMVKSSIDVLKYQASIDLVDYKVKLINDPDISLSAKDQLKDDILNILAEVMIQNGKTITTIDKPIT